MATSQKYGSVYIQALLVLAKANLSSRPAHAMDTDDATRFVGQYLGVRSVPPSGGTKRPLKSPTDAAGAAAGCWRALRSSVLPSHAPSSKW